MEYLAEEGYHRLGDRCNPGFAAAADPLDALRLALWAFYEFSKAFTEYFEPFEPMFLDRSVPRLSQDVERFRPSSTMHGSRCSKPSGN